MESRTAPVLVVMPVLYTPSSTKWLAGESESGVLQAATALLSDDKHGVQGGPPPQFPTITVVENC